MEKGHVSNINTDIGNDEGGNDQPTSDHQGQQQVWQGDKEPQHLTGRSLVQARSYARLVDHDTKMQSFLEQRHAVKTTTVPRIGEWAVQTTTVAEMARESREASPKLAAQPGAPLL